MSSKIYDFRNFDQFFNGLWPPQPSLFRVKGLNIRGQKARKCLFTYLLSVKALVLLTKKKGRPPSGRHNFLFPLPSCISIELSDFTGGVSVKVYCALH